MKNVLNHITSLPKGMLLFLLIYAASFPVVLIGAYTHTFSLVDWLGLSPALVWKGQVWRLLTYAFFANGVLVWVVNLFWFLTIISLLARNWSSTSFWTFCATAAVASALPIVLLFPTADFRIVSAGGLVFALLVAWDHLYRRERLIMLGLGEVSVRQAAIFIGVINAIIVFFSCGGWLMTLSLLCGAVAGWLYLLIGKNRLLRGRSRIVESERMARIEL